MYNREQKEAFIRQYAKNRISETTVKSFFKRSAPFEEKLKKDLGLFTSSDLQELFNSFDDITRNTVMLYRTCYRSYIRWGTDCGKDWTDQLGSVSVVFQSPATKFVGSPEHLEAELNRRFLPESDMSVDNIYRAYYWLAYAGVRESDAISLTGAHIHSREGEIVYNNRTYPIYDQAAECLANCATMTSFKVHIVRKGAPYIRTLNRTDGDQLLRSTRNLCGSRQWYNQMINYHPIPNESEFITLQYLYIWKSGIFYRMYERELAGIPVDFSDSARLYIEGREYNLNSLHGRIRYRIQRVDKQMREEYMIWKEAFAL